MLTSNITTNILENHSEFSVRANSCNKLFKSIFINREITCDTVMKRHLRPPLPPFWKERGQCPRHVPLAGVHGVTLRYKVRSCDIRKALDVELHLRIQRPQLRWLAIYPKCPGKDWKAGPAGYTHRKATHSPTKDQVEWLHLRPCLVPSWCGTSRTTWDCCWSWGISSLHKTAAPATRPREKVGRKMNEKNEYSRLNARYCTDQDIFRIQASFYILFSWWQKSPVCLKMPSAIASWAERGKLCGNFHIAIISNA